jgi:hypothetical protein
MVYRSRYVLAVVAIALSACSSPRGGAHGPTPTVTITSPADGATVTLDFPAGENTVNGTVETTNFKVAAADQPGDGQVWILVDGPQCNEHSNLGALLPYNTTVPSDDATVPMDGKSFQAGVDYCFNAPPQDIVIAGPHTLTAELHRNDGSLVTAGGKTVSTSVTVHVVLAPGDGGTEAGADGG